MLLIISFILVALMFDPGVCCKEKWDVSLFGVKGLNFPQIFYNNFTVQECKVLFCYP